MMTPRVCPIDDCGTRLGIIAGLDYWTFTLDDGSTIRVCPAHGAEILAAEQAEQKEIAA